MPVGLGSQHPCAKSEDQVYNSKESYYVNPRSAKQGYRSQIR